MSAQRTTRSRSRFAVYAILVLVVATAVLSQLKHLERRLSAIDSSVRSLASEIDSLRSDIENLQVVR